MISINQRNLNLYLKHGFTHRLDKPETRCEKFSNYAIAATVGWSLIDGQEVTSFSAAAFGVLLVIRCAMCCFGKVDERDWNIIDANRTFKDKDMPSLLAKKYYIKHPSDGQWTDEKIRKVAKVILSAAEKIHIIQGMTVDEYTDAVIAQMKNGVTRRVV